MLFPACLSSSSLAAVLLFAPALIKSSPLDYTPLGDTTRATTPGTNAGAVEDPTAGTATEEPGAIAGSSNPSSKISGQTFTVSNTFTVSVHLNDGTQGTTTTTTQTFANVNASLALLYTTLSAPNTTHQNLIDPVNATTSNTMSGFTSKPPTDPTAGLYGSRPGRSTVPLDVSYADAAQVIKGLQGFLVGKTIGGVLDILVMRTVAVGVAQGATARAGGGEGVCEGGEQGGDGAGGGVCEVGALKRSLS